MKINNISYNQKEELPKENILGVDVTNATKENILEFIINSLKKLQKPYYIVTPNPEMIVLANKNREFREVLNSAKIATNDGIGVSIAAKIMAKSLHERFTGLDLVEKVCEKSNDWPITVGFLGGGANVAEMTAECLVRRFPKLEVVFAKKEWDEKAMEDSEKSIDILFVAFGVPKQEFWMADKVGKIPVKVMVGVGGAFDQIIHPSLRPPRVVQHVGLGWLYRLIRQPWRIKRQLALLTFCLLVFRKKLRQS